MKKRMAGRNAVFAACWFTYVVAYLCRVNFSSAMLKLSGEMQVSAAQLGAAGSAFFVVYALGQGSFHCCGVAGTPAEAGGGGGGG